MADVPATLPYAAPLWWHPRFLAHTTAHGQVVLLEDGDAMLFEEGAAARVARAVSEHASHIEILGMEREVTEQAALQAALDQLVALDLVQTADAHRLASPAYVRPAIHAEPTVLGAPGEEVVLLADLSAHDPVVDWARAFASAHDVAVAVADDELDPRLEDVDPRFRAGATPWLLVKPRGRRPSLGPWFAGASGPCWCCLASRLLCNQPVRRWLVAQAPSPSLAVPVAAETVPAPSLAASHLDAVRSGALLHLDRRTGEIVRAHHVARVQHCRVCGEPSERRPLHLRSTPRRPHPDGGYRSHDPEDTLAVLSRHVSPVTGSVADVSALPGHASDHVPIHRSAVLTCPLARSIVRPADFHRVALGKGRSASQSRASALCEALERSVAQYRGDEPAVLAAAEALGERVLAPPILTPLSSRQREGRPAWSEGEPMHWVDVHSLTRGDVCKAPLTHCYANTPFEREEQLTGFDSNGCAAGRTLEEALLQGLLEVVERDAVAIWWYNRLVVPALPPSIVGPELLDAMRAAIEPDWAWWLLDVTHDLETPVCVAVARRRRDGQHRLGFGCHLEAALAAQRAVTELCQLIAVGERRGGRFDFASIAAEPYLDAPSTPATDAPALAASTAPDDIRDAVEACVARLGARGLEALVHRYPAIDDALVVVKAIVPGACHIWPRLGAARLYQVPVDRGSSARRLAEDELNPLGLFV